MVIPGLFFQRFSTTLRPTNRRKIEFSKKFLEFSEKFLEFSKNSLSLAKKTLEFCKNSMRFLHVHFESKTHLMVLRVLKTIALIVHRSSRIAFFLVTVVKSCLNLISRNKPAFMFEKLTKNSYLKIAENLSLGKNVLEFSEKSLSLAKTLSLFLLEFSKKS